MSKKKPIIPPVPAPAKFASKLPTEEEKVKTVSKITNSSPISLKNVVSYLNGSLHPTDVEEVKKLSTLIQNYSKAGNGFLHIFVYKSMERAANLLDVLTAIESRLFVVEDKSTEDLLTIHKQITQSLDKTIDFIDRICNKGFEKKIVTNNILINTQNPDVMESKPTQSSSLTKEQRQNIRDLYLKLTEATKQE